MVPGMRYDVDENSPRGSMMAGRGGRVEEDELHRENRRRMGLADEHDDEHEDDSDDDVLGPPPSLVKAAIMDGRARLGLP